MHSDANSQIFLGRTINQVDQLSGYFRNEACDNCTCANWVALESLHDPMWCSQNACLFAEHAFIHSENLKKPTRRRSQFNTAIKVQFEQIVDQRRATL